MQQKLKYFKIMYFIHSSLYLILVIIHSIIYFKVYWISNISKKIFFIEIFIIFCFGIIPVFLVAFLSVLNLTKKMLEVYQLLTIIFLFFFILNGLIITFIIYNNARLLSPFFYLCPFSYDIHEISNIFENYQIDNKKEIKKRCNNRRCFFNNELKINNYYINYYICNFKAKDKEIKCTELMDTGGVSNNIIKYIKYCENYSKLYVCEKLNNLIVNKISYETICPSNFDNIFNIVLSFCMIFVDTFLFSLPWLFEFFLSQELIINLFPNYSNRNEQSLKETNNTSKISENIQENNSENFQREPTKTIIIDNSEHININQNLNNDNILSINNKKNNVIGKILVKKEFINVNDLSKSCNNLISNNNNMLKTINYNIKSKNSNIEY